MVMEQQRQRRHSFFIPSFANIIFVCYLMLFCVCVCVTAGVVVDEVDVVIVVVVAATDAVTAAVLFKHSSLMPKVILYWCRVASFFLSFNSMFRIFVPCRIIFSIVAVVSVIILVLGRCRLVLCDLRMVKRTLLMDNCFVN